MREALLVAVDAYRPPHTLHSAVADLNALHEILRMSGFSITALVDAQATKANILSALGNMAKAVTKPGGAIFFAFFGHGSQLPSTEDDGTSECLCAYDWETGGLVWDHEVEPILANLPPLSTCELFFGCCFSGGIVEKPGIPIISWQACREEEYAYWVRLEDGSERGLFPLMFERAFWENPLATRRDVFSNAAYWTQHYAPDQHPVLKCDDSERYQLLFL